MFFRFCRKDIGLELALISIILSIYIMFWTIKIVVNLIITIAMSLTTKSLKLMLNRVIQ